MRLLAWVIALVNIEKRTDGALSMPETLAGPFSWVGLMPVAVFLLFFISCFIDLSFH
jgi:hypothetical protein